MAEQVITPVCRAAWTQNVFTPKKVERVDKKTGQVDVVDKWGCQLVFDQSMNEGLQKMMDAAFREGQEAFGENFWALVQQGSIKWPFRNGAEINPKTGQPRYEQGTTFINASSGTPIDVVSKYCDPADPQRKPIKVTDPSQLWPGQYVRAAVTFKAYKKESWGVACYINGLQLQHVGERWGDSFDAQSAFDAEGEAPTGQFGPASSPQSAPAAPTAPPAPSATANTPGPAAGPTPAPASGPSASGPTAQPPTAPGAPQAAPAAPTAPGPTAAPTGSPSIPGSPSTTPQAAPTVPSGPSAAPTPAPAAAPTGNGGSSLL